MFEFLKVALPITLLVFGDYVFTNRENVRFALQCAQNKWLRRNELR